MSGPKRVSIMGVTGSIGQSAASVIDYANANASVPVFDVVAVSAGRDVRGLAANARRLGARHAVIADPGGYEALKSELDGTGISVAAGDQAVAAAAAMDCDRVLAAIVGIAGLRSTLAAVEAGNSVALANKESMVCAGPLLNARAAKTGAHIVPTDSEHNAMFQVLERRSDIEKLVLTASGGPFRNSSLAEMRRATPDEACAHPKWRMGRKISCDSASLFNKGLELIEAAYLFDVPQQMIDVVVHPQSAIHSLVAYRDGSMLAQLGHADMQTPIAHALSWPGPRYETDVPMLDLIALARMDFEPLDAARFPSVGLARRALDLGGGAPALLNCANEVGVAAFLARDCGFLDICWLVERALDLFEDSAFDGYATGSLEEIEALDAEGRRTCTRLLSEMRMEARGG